MLRDEHAHLCDSRSLHLGLCLSWRRGGLACLISLRERSHYSSPISKGLRSCCNTWVSSIAVCWLNADRCCAPLSSSFTGTKSIPKETPCSSPLRAPPMPSRLP